jgi:beta-1,4-N-acetylglucosaminyltransferase
MKKICIACSAGGHLTEAKQLLPTFENNKFYFLTTKRMDTIELSKKYKTIFITDPGRNPISLIKNIFETISVLKTENPDIIISTGAGIAIPTIIIGKLTGKKTIFIESICRITKPSLAGKIAYPFSDLFLVQWEKMLEKIGKKAKYWGAVI